MPLGRAHELRPLRRHVQMVFQDPYASLNPRRTVAEILDTVLVVNGIGNAQQRRSRIATMLDRVGLPSSALGRFHTQRVLRWPTATHWHRAGAGVGTRSADLR